jgi:glycosyltransferase involved in cell wall biosynthesis
VSRRYRVFHLIKGLGRGGAEVLLEQCLRFGDQRRYEYGFGYFLPRKDAIARPLREQGAEVVCFEAPGEISILRSSGRVADYLRRRGVDLLHAHLPLSGVVGRWAGRRAGVPVVYTEHNIQERYGFPTRWLNLATWSMQARVIAVSDRVAASIAAWKDGDVPVEVIRNGVDVERFRYRPEDRARARERLGIAADAPVVGTVAVFRVQKRLHDWLAAARAVLDRRPDARFLLVGDGPLRDELRATVAAWGMEHAVLFPGLQEDVRPFVAAMDVTLVTSMFEGLPVALLEAMAMERPVVVTPVGGIPEIVRAGENGVLVPVGRSDEAAAAILGLLAEPERAARFAAAGRLTVERNFSAATMVQRVEAIYQQVLGGPRD